VHEGPHGIANRISCNDTALQPGMTVTNEPGYYQEGEFGIRIENIMLVKKFDTKYSFDDTPFYGFEKVTMVPLCKSLLKKEIMTKEEIDWVNSYHKEIWTKVSPLLEGKDAYNWLKIAVSEI
jgi:Xaa-Pro aminopeptidase